MKVTAAVLALVIAFAATVAATPPASAAGLVTEARSSPLRLTGFDRAVAGEHGYKIITLANGSEASIRRTELRRLGPHATESALLAHASAVVDAGGVRPATTVYGDCGESSIALTIAKNGTWRYYTGFLTNNPVVYYDWQAEMHRGPTSTYSMRWDDSYDGEFWIRDAAGDMASDAQRGHEYDAAVLSGRVILANGAFCTSGDPTSVAVYR